MFEINIPDYLTEPNKEDVFANNNNLIDVPVYLTQPFVIDLTLHSSCGTCQSYCQDCQGATCQSVCQGCMENCMAYCQNACEGSTQTCESCMSACQSSSQTGGCDGASCMSACQGTCEIVCQNCQETCQISCQNCQGVACQTCQNCQGVACQTTQGCTTGQSGGTTVAVTGIVGSPNELRLLVNQTGTISASVIPSNATNQTINWSSDNTSVATVSNGTVSAKSVGECIITARTQDGSYAYHTFVYVTASTTVPVTSVNLTADGFTEIYVGQTLQFRATVYPNNATNKNVTFNSSNTSVATINSNGLATAVGIGSTTIMVTTEDGNFTDTDILTVTTSDGGYVSVSSVTISPTNSVDLAVNDTYQFSATVMPNNATDPSVSWSSSNTAIATVSNNGLVTAKSQGTCTITVISNSNTSLSSSAIVKVIPLLTTWSWSYNIVSGGDIQSVSKINDTTYYAYIIPATEWNDFTSKINIMRQKKGKIDYPFTTQIKDNNFTKDVVNDAINALNDIGGNMSYVNYGNIPAQTFIDLKDTFNAILATIP